MKRSEALKILRKLSIYNKDTLTSEKILSFIEKEIGMAPPCHSFLAQTCEKEDEDYNYLPCHHRWKENCENDWEPE